MLKLRYLLVCVLLNTYTVVAGQTVSLYANDSLAFQSFNHTALILNPVQSRLKDGYYNVFSESDSTKLLYCFRVKDRTIEGAVFTYNPATGALREVYIYENKILLVYIKKYEGDSEYEIFSRE